MTNYETFDAATNTYKQNIYANYHFLSNPNWVLNRQPKDDRIRRAISSLNINYEFSEKLSFQARASLDYSNKTYEQQHYASSNPTSASEEQGEVKPITSDDAYLILENASSVLVVPGYGMAVAQAQHVVREMGELLEENGTEVKYGIHPVAGRMPGHMNVLLAEANVSYDLLAEPDDVNPSMDTIDVAIVIGANDVVNPSATEEEGSPIYGMPIIEVHNAKTVFVLKRSMSSGFAGVQNPLFFRENTRMLFGDAKESIGQIVAEFKD